MTNKEMLKPLDDTINELRNAIDNSKDAKKIDDYWEVEALCRAFVSQLELSRKFKEIK